MNQPQTPYILAEGKNATNRLDFQHKLFQGKLVEAFKKASSLKTMGGTTVVDFGCGVSSSYEDIRIFIGPYGKYIGIDSFHEQIAFNQTRFKDAYYVVGTENSSEVMSVLSSADIVYLRFVVMHQKNQREFIKKIYDAVKSKAILIVQEPENTAEQKAEMVKKYPSSGDLWDLKSKIGRKIGLDYNFAKHLEPIFKEMNPEAIIHTAETIDVPLSQAKELFEQSIREIHNKDNGILTASEMAHYLALISKLPNDDHAHCILDLFHSFIVQKK